MLRDQTLALANLTELFDLSKAADPNGYLYVVVVRTTKMQIGLIVDALVGEEEVVVKSFGSLIGDIPGISSAAILGDGQIALIVDVQGLFKLAGLH
jgi:two-component system chemotaxis sensor kinase CheA